MYGYTMHVAAPIEAYRALHKAVMEVVDEAGGVDGLVLHLAYATEAGFDLTEVWASKEQLDSFNAALLPKAMARAGVAMDGPGPDVSEFEPVVVMAPRAFTSEAMA
jgi:hypothetical protein